MNNNSTKYLIFTVDEEYALDIANVVEIIEMTDITKVPETPDYISGIINLRGHVVPVLDIRKRFRKTGAGTGKPRCIVIANIEDNQLGLIVDNVVDLVDIEKDMIKDPPQVGSNYVHVFVKSIGITGDKMHLIVDTDKLVNYNDLSFLEEGEALLQEGE